MTALYVILAGVIVYTLYVLLWKRTHSTIVKGPISLLDVVPPVTGLSSPTLAHSSFALWVYVNQWSADTAATLFSAKNTDGSVTTYSLGFDATTPTLRFTVRYGDKTDVIDITEYFPLQRWTYVVIAIDDRTVDCFLDGKLLKTAYVSGAYKPVVNQIVFGSKFDCQITNFERNVDNSLRAPADIQKAYYAGNGMPGTGGIPAVSATAEIKRDGQTIFQVGQ